MSYTKNSWATGDVVTASKMNHMEDGIFANDTAVAEKYTKPDSGIPETDLSQEVLESLERADDAVSYNEQTGQSEQDKATARENINAAAPNGYYGTSGGVFQYATNFLGKNTPQNASNVVFRPTASNFSGSGWSADSISGQTATIEKIKGKTLVFNQLAISSWFQSKPGVTVTDNHDGSYTFNGTASSILWIGSNINSINGHKYYFSLGNASNTQLKIAITNITTEIYTSGILTSNGKVIVAYCMGGASFNNEKFIPQIIDLTQMYGAGNEPATVEEFKAQFPLDYYAYNEGELISFNGIGLKTNGFNQLDIDNANIVDASSTHSISQGKVTVSQRATYGTSTINLDGLFPNTTYCFSCKLVSVTGQTGNTAVRSGKTYDTSSQTNLTVGQRTTITFTTDSEGVWCIGLRPGSGNAGVMVVSDLNLNIAWSGIRNGEYEPYWDSTLSLPIATYFPEGMNGVGTAFDELTKDKAIKRFSKVDLGTLNWSVSGGRFVGRRSDVKGRGKSLCPKFETTTRGYRDMDDKELSTYWLSITSSNGVIIRDDSYTDVSTFKAAMSGVYLYYELEEPVETPISPELNLTYRCDDFGTEMLLPQNDDEPITAPMDADITYQLDYEADVRNMGQNMISKESMDSFVSAFNGSGLGNISMVYDAQNKRYNFIVTAPPTNE